MDDSTSYRADLLATTQETFARSRFCHERIPFADHNRPSPIGIGPLSPQAFG
jgi:hypothetical protein